MKFDQIAALQARIAELEAEIAELRTRLSRRGRGGKKPIFDHPLTPAERAQRYREKKRNETQKSD